MAEPTLMCLVCMYVRPRPGLDEDSLAELDVLTVANGQMVCMRHVSSASSDRNRTLLNGVHHESNGEIDSLSAYQDWRHRQDAEDPRG